MPATAEVERRVMEIVCEQSNADPADVARETRLIELGDSLDRVESVMKLEEEFELSIPDDKADKLLTVGELIDYIVARTGRRAAAGVSDPGQPRPGAGGA